MCDVIAPSLSDTLHSQHTSLSYCYSFPLSQHGDDLFLSAHWRWQAVTVSLWTTLSLLSALLSPPSLSLSPSLHLLMPLLLSQHCGALFFYSTHFTHPSLFFAFSLYLSAVTHSLRGYISGPKREGWDQRKKHRRTLTHKHKHFVSLLLGTKTFETHSGQLQYWITTAGRSDVCVSVVWGGREPGQDSVFGPSPMGPQRLRTESYSETSTVRGEIPALSSLHLSHPERTTAQRGTGQVDHGGRFAC